MGWAEMLWDSIVMNPSPVIGGVLGGLITGGLFGWLGHVRSIRPILVFFRDPGEDKPKWKIKNIGQGGAMHIRIRDYSTEKDIVRKVHAYALVPGQSRTLAWVTSGFKLEVDYTDAYGRRWYRSVAKDNDTVYKRRYGSLWRRPPRREFAGYEPEIHVIRALRKEPTADEFA